MRRLAPLALLLGLAVFAGCGKKPAPPAPDAGGGVVVEPDAPPDPAAARNKLLATLKSNGQEVRRNAIEDLSWLAEDDPAVLPALVEMLKDKGTDRKSVV